MATWNDLLAVLPMVVLVATAVGVLVLDLGLRRGVDRSVLALAGCLGILAALVLAVQGWGRDLTAFGGAVVVDDFARFFWALICGVGLMAVASSPGYAARQGMDRGEYYSLLLLALVGMQALVASGDLLTFFVALETLSIALYGLAGYTRFRLRSVEAAMKYFVLGALSAGFLLFGLALVFTATGSFDLAVLAVVAPDSDPLLLAGVGLLLAGLAFKAGAVPFHWWVPDVYEGAPAPVTGFMAAGVKAAAFAALVRVAAPMTSGVGLLGPVLWVLAVATLVLGSVLAIRQDNIKRMLAYSSITHTGYLLIGLLAGLTQGGDMSAVPFYAAVYALMVLGAFGVLAHLSGSGRSGAGRDLERIDDLRGLALERPGVAALLGLFMIGLAGIPPTAGFVGKFYLFRSAVSAGYVGLAVLGVLASVVSLFYYVRVLYVAFQAPESGSEARAFASLPRGGAVVAVAGVLALLVGLFPGGLWQAARDSVAGLW